jgi:hypothetical protein
VLERVEELGLERFQEQAQESVEELDWDQFRVEGQGSVQERGLAADPDQVTDRVADQELNRARAEDQVEEEYRS